MAEIKTDGGRPAPGCRTWRAYGSLSCLLVGLIWAAYWLYQAALAEPDEINPGLAEGLLAGAGMMVMNLLGILLASIELHYRSQPARVVNAGWILNDLFLLLTGLTMCGFCNSPLVACLRWLHDMSKAS